MWHDVLSAALSETWVVNRSKLPGLLIQAKDVEIPRRIKLPKVSGSVAILPVYGVIHQRPSVWDEVFGGTSTQALGASFVRAMSDERIGAVVLDVDSPGGTVAGVEELSDLIWRWANEQGIRKPVVAIANSEMASAAYWISSQVGAKQLRLVASPGSHVGSIGIYVAHEDISDMLAADGIKVTLISAGEHKTEGNPFEPLSADARDHIQSQIDITYDTFVNHVARGRGVLKSHVKESFGGGRDFNAKQAADMGLVDRVATIGKVLQELGDGSIPKLTKAQSRAIEEDLCAAWGRQDEAFVPAAPHVSNRLRELRLRMRLDK